MRTLEKLTPPPLGAILAFKGVYALCTLNKEGRLRATHFTACLLGGPDPIWGVYTIEGNFVRFAARKAMVEAAYPKLVWRRQQASWSLANLHETDERKALRKMYKRGETLAQEPVAALLPNGNIVPWNPDLPAEARSLYFGRDVEIAPPADSAESTESDGNNILTHPRFQAAG